MKFRNDFVTNSSSSSFIVAYKTYKSLLDDLNKFSQSYEDSWYEEQYHRVVFDIVKNRLSYDDAIKTVRKFADDDCWCKFANLFSQYGYKSQSDWTSTEDYKKLCKSYVDSAENKFKSKFNKNSWIALLEYSDSDGFYEINENLQNMISGVYATNKE